MKKIIIKGSDIASISLWKELGEPDGAQEIMLYRLEENESLPVDCEVSKPLITKEEFNKTLKKLFRQLGERLMNKNSEQSYQNKRKEFIGLIDKAMLTDWFKTPERGTRIYSIYFDRWD